LKIHVLHGSVATQLKCVEIFDNNPITNCQENVPVEEF